MMWGWRRSGAAGADEGPHQSVQALWGTAMNSLLSRSGSGRVQVVLAAVSLAFALGLLIVALLDAPAVGGGVGVVIAVLFAINGLARLWLWRRTRRR